MGTFPCSQMSTSVHVGGDVGNHILHLCVIGDVSEFANENTACDGSISVVMPTLSHSRHKASMADRDPMDRAHPRSRMTYKGFFFMFMAFHCSGLLQKQVEP